MCDKDFSFWATRRNIGTPQLWAVDIGTDYWAFFASNGALTAGNGHELSDYGWTTTTLALSDGQDADFITSADIGTPGGMTLADASDVLKSPAIFGDYAHARAVQGILGYLPTQLIVEVYAAFTTVINNETATAFGLYEAGGAPADAAAAMATVYSDGTNFGLRSGAAADAGAAVDTSFHLWRIEVDATNIEWFIDGTSQGTLALQADLWPVSFGAGVVAAGANDIVLKWAHLWYV